MTGVHGIALAPEFNKGFISDGKGNAVVVFDLLHVSKLIKTIPITGKDPDAIMYDPYSKQVFTFNGDSQDATVIDADKMVQTKSIPLGGTPEFAVSDGAGKIYNNLEDKNRAQCDRCESRHSPDYVFHWIPVADRPDWPLISHTSAFIQFAVKIKA